MAHTMPTAIIIMKTWVVVSVEKHLGGGGFEMVRGCLDAEVERKCDGSRVDRSGEQRLTKKNFHPIFANALLVAWRYTKSVRAIETMQSDTPLLRI